MMLQETKENPIFELGDVVIIRRNANCKFNWISYMDRFAGEEHVIVDRTWDQYRSCYCYKVNGLMLVFDAGCFILKDTDNYEPFEPDNAAFDALYSAFAIR